MATSLQVEHWRPARNMVVFSSCALVTHESLLPVGTPGYSLGRAWDLIHLGLVDAGITIAGAILPHHRATSRKVHRIAFFVSDHRRSVGMVPFANSSGITLLIRHG
jgi:hypothetical protein